MKTGFYNINNLSNIKLKKFFKDAVMLSYDTHIDELKGWTREMSNEKTIKEMIEACNNSYHNVCIDRSIQHQYLKYGEIGYSIISDKYFLYIYVTLENLKLLVDKYKLEMN